MNEEELERQHRYPHFSKIGIMPFSSDKRPTLVPVFANRKAQRRTFASTIKGEKHKEC